MINVIVILTSGLVALFGYNYIPYKAYVIVAAFVGLLTAYILTKVKKNYEWLVSYNLLWIDNLSN